MSSASASDSSADARALSASTAGRVADTLTTPAHANCACRQETSNFSCTPPPPPMTENWIADFSPASLIRGTCFVPLPSDQITKSISFFCSKEILTLVPGAPSNPNVWCSLGASSNCLLSEGARRIAAFETITGAFCAAATPTHSAKIAAGATTRENPDHELKRRLPRIFGLNVIDAIRTYALRFKHQHPFGAKESKRKYHGLEYTGRTAGTTRKDTIRAKLPQPNLWEYQPQACFYPAKLAYRKSKLFNSRRSSKPALLQRVTQMPRRLFQPPLQCRHILGQRVEFLLRQRSGLGHFVRRPIRSAHRRANARRYFRQSIFLRHDFLQIKAQPS